MRKFWFWLWFRWALWVSIFTFVSAGVSDLLLTVVIYLLKGAPDLDSVMIDALFDIWKFWFVIILSVTLLLGIFLSMKRIFNVCYEHHKLQLLTCKDAQVIDIVLLGDTLKVWRRWLMILIWGISVEVLIVSVVRYIAGFSSGFWEWFSIEWLYLFMLIASLVSMPMLLLRCKRIRVVRC